MNLLIRLFLLSVVSVCIFSTRTTYAATLCATLPVCQISDKIAELRLATRNDRVAFYTMLTNTYKSSRDQAVLENLIDFSLEAYKLSVELDSDETWVVNLTADLLNRSLDYILIGSSIDGNLYGRWFGLFIGDSASAHRFQSLNFWDNQVKKSKLIVTNDLRQLVLFMKLAATTADSLNDEIYVGNFARNIGEAAGIQLLKMAPFMEGVFSIQLHCQNIDIKLCPQMDKFSLVIGDDWRGVQAAFIQTGLTIPVYEFGEVKIIDETTIYGETGPGDYSVAPGSFRLEFNRLQNTFKGTIRTPRTQIEIEVTGQRIISTDQLYQMSLPSPLISIDQIEGRYLGQISLSQTTGSQILPKSVAFNMMIDRFGDNSFKATMRDNTTDQIIYDFPSAYFYKNLDVVTSYTENEFGLLKITWAYRLTNGKAKWIGLAHSLRTGQYYSLEMPAKN